MSIVRFPRPTKQRISQSCEVVMLVLVNGKLTKNSERLAKAIERQAKAKLRSRERKALS